VPETTLVVPVVAAIVLAVTTSTRQILRLMNAIEVRGIDRDEEPRTMTIADLTPYEVARIIHAADWKFALLVRDGRKVGGVEFSVKELKRVWWGEPE
jgi:hypothetical protein